jgi:hypothetical protein
MLKEAGWLVQSKGYGSVVELLERIKGRKQNAKILRLCATSLTVEKEIQIKQILDK